VQSLANFQRYSNEGEKMKAYWGVAVCAIFMVAGLGLSDLCAQENPAPTSVLHMQQTQTTTQGATYLQTYKVLNGANSSVNMLALKGTLKLKNYDPTFSQILWELVYWQGECPPHDINLTKVAGYLWSDIIKNPKQSDSTFSVDLQFPNPIATSGCIGLYYGGGSLVEGTVTMSADLDLTYQPTTANPNTVLDLSGEYCFGQTSGCQNATAEDEFGFAVPTALSLPSHLLELYGNISDSTFDGTKNFGPLPTGTEWGATNDFYLLPGGCGEFGENLNFQNFPNPLPLTLLYSWLPDDALHLASVPFKYKIPDGRTGKAALQGRVEKIFSTPVPVNAGDCLLVIYGRKGNGATDDETQVHALMAP
jgi:hypothetical protein